LCPFAPAHACTRRLFTSHVTLLHSETNESHPSICRSTWLFRPSLRRPVSMCTSKCRPVRCRRRLSSLPNRLQSELFGRLAFESQNPRRQLRIFQSRNCLQQGHASTRRGAGRRQNTGLRCINRGSRLPKANTVLSTQ
jgi:hypothetical protein